MDETTSVNSTGRSPHFLVVHLTWTLARLDSSHSRAVSTGVAKSIKQYKKKKEWGRIAPNREEEIRAVRQAGNVSAAGGILLFQNLSSSLPSPHNTVTFADDYDGQL